MVKFGILATLEAKIGKEHEVAAFLKSALPLVEAEPGTVSWFAIRISPSTFGIFDVFHDEAGRDAHLAGEVAKALMAKAPELFSPPPEILLSAIRPICLKGPDAEQSRVGTQGLPW